MTTSQLLDTIRFSTRYAVRTLARSPLFSLPVVLCIALVIAANSTVFSIVDALMLQAVPFEEPDRLVSLASVHVTPGMEPEELSVSPRDFLAWREQAKSYSAMATVYARSFNLAAGPGDVGADGDDLEPERVEGARVSPSFFDVLRVRPERGRAFLAQEEQPGLAPVAILSDGLWRRRFGGDPDVVGKVFLVDGESVRVVGVMPPGFRHPNDSEIWTPQRFEPDSPTHVWHYIRPVGRLAPGVEVEEARAELAQIASRLEEEFPDTNRGWSATVEPLFDELVGELKPRLLALSAGVALLLVIGCANVANLLLARGVARSRDMAVRAAMGSSRARLVTLVLMEGVWLALAGGAVGLFITYFATQGVSRLPLDIPSLRNVAVDFRVIGFTLLVALVTGLLFSAAPALRLLRLSPQTFLKDGTRGASQGRRTFRIQGLFVVMQVAITLVLLTTAALLVQSFNALEAVDPGFDPENLLTTRVSLPESRYPGSTERVLFADQIVERVEKLPGVRAAALTTALPIGDRDVDFSSSFSIEGRIPTDEGSKFVATIRRVTPGYFDALGVGLVEGRLFQASDRANTPGVVVVSRTMAQQYWPGESAVGKRLKQGDYDAPGPWLEVVGVVADVKDDGLQSDFESIWYRPYSQHETKSSRYVALVARTDVDPASLLQPVREEVQEMDKLLPVYNVRTMEALLAESLAQSRVIATVFGVLSLLGLVIAAIGLYGVMSYVVNQRLQEIGIRMAIGAGRSEVVGLVLRRGMVLAGLGTVLGFCATAFVASPLSALLYGVDPMDFLTFAAVATLLAVVAVLANLLPARRATRVDPLISLRQG